MTNFCTTARLTYDLTNGKVEINQKIIKISYNKLDYSIN